MPRTFSKLLFPLVVAAMAQVVFAGEGLWPIQSVPKELMQKECGFAPDAAWIDNIRQACVKIGPQGSGGGGSGAFVSHQGLIVTNRHCVVDALSQQSNATRNLVKDGIYAATPDQELESGLEVYVLAQVRDVTDKAKQDLGDSPSPEKLHQVRAAIQRTAPQGTFVDLVSYFGGAQVWLYIYQTYPVKLVFVPDENFGAFGGEDDNFCYPRHKLDIAFVRAYGKDGKPVNSEHLFSISADGPKDGEQLFVAGHPGFSQRHLPLAEIEYLRDIDLPLKVATYEAAVKALTDYMATGEDQRKKAAGDFEHWANEMKIYQGALKYFQTAGVIDAHKKLEQQWRDDLSKSKSKDDYLKAFDDLAAARKELAQGAALRHFCAMPRGNFYGLASSLNRFAEVTRGKTDDEIQPIVKSFSNFLEHILDPSVALNLEAERVVLTAWLTVAKDKLPADSPFLKIALNGQSPADAAKHLLENADQIMNKEKLIGLLSHGAAGIEGAKVPLLNVLEELAKLNKDAASVATEENRCHADLSLLERGLSEAYGAALAPEASNTLRLGWGNVCGYTENGKDIPWSTTFDSMVALSDARKHAYPYELSEKFKAAQKNVELKTPLDFVSTLDGAPGSSGSPVFTKDAKLVGVLFDGNQQDVPTIYDYIPKETGARAIAVDSAAIWAALEKVYDAKALVEELKGK